jgi:chloramphenicol-sensitive protein RarD
MKKGVWYAAGAYVAWGLFPVYWKQVDRLPAIEVIGHRILWSFLTLAALIAFTDHRKAFKVTELSRRVVLIYTASAVLISINWFTFVWAVNSGFVVETSLGYFINPLVSVLFGVVLLRERLRPLQWLAIALAAAGVAYLSVVHGSIPWIALVLAVSFGSYGLLKKTAPLGAVDGLTVETGLLFLPALGYLWYLEAAGYGAFLRGTGFVQAVLVGAGPVTTIPLLLFASAARRIPLSLIGVLQYIAPSLQFLFGVLLYREPFTRAQLVGFGLVWSALLVFGVEGVWTHRRYSSPVPAVEVPADRALS